MDCVSGVVEHSLGLVGVPANDEDVVCPNEMVAFSPFKSKPRILCVPFVLDWLEGIRY